MSYFWMMIKSLEKPVLRSTKLLLCLLLVQFSHAQTKVLRGIIKDAHSDERIPFASLQFKAEKNGKLSDSAGTFVFRFDESEGWG